MTTQQKIWFILIMLSMVAGLAVKFYDLGYSHAQWHHEDQLMQLKIKHSDELDQVLKEKLEVHRELERTKQKAKDLAAKK